MKLRSTLACSILIFISTSSAFAQALPGTKLLENKGNPSREMVEGINKYFERMLAASVQTRQKYWKADFSSTEAYQKSVAANRARLCEIIGVAAERSSKSELIYVSSLGNPASPAETSCKMRIRSVRWGVYPGFEAEGLLVEPTDGQVLANVVYLPDADQTPEAALLFDSRAGKPEAIWRPLLHQPGLRILVPTLVSRARDFSGSPTVRPSKLTHREWIYRMAYEGGKHIIGYEVDEVRAAIDCFSPPNQPNVPTGVAGYGEGGLIALFAAAIDPRVSVVGVRGYFAPRENVWKEPIDRNVWGLLERFGDAELAALIAPRKLIVEALRVPNSPGAVPGFGAPTSPTSGRLETPKIAEVEKEFERAKATYERLGRPDAILLAKTVDDAGMLNSDEQVRASSAFLGALGIQAPSKDQSPFGVDCPTQTEAIDQEARQKHIVDQLTELTQKHIRTSELRRYEYWKKADLSSLEKYEASTEQYRQRFWDDLIGKLPPPTEPLSVESVLAYDEPKWKGYAVKLPLYNEVFASGVLLVPKDLKEGERRPVVVCQHGLEGTPEPIVDRKIKSVYNAFGAQLADRGYIVYAPQNPYIYDDGFRAIMRKANPLGLNLFSVIVRQHERTLEWLKTLSFVDPNRIAFYGLSYGGKTAMRVPAILKDYCLSICSADFNEWVVKCTNVDRSYSYLYTIEYDMYEFGLSERFNYAEMAALIAPRPFMVERGHQDGVAPDEWIGYEFAKIRRLYDTLGISDRAAISYFNGGHMIKGEATFEFLDRNLNWSSRK